MEDVNRKMVFGAIWSMAARLADRGLGLISTLVLVRILTPDDFGLLALAMTVVAFLQIFSQFGFSVVLIQKENPEKFHYDTVWTIRLIILTAITIAGVGISGWAADFYGDDRLQDLVICLSGLILLKAIHNIGVVDYTRELRFKLLFWAQLGRKSVSLVVTLIAAYYLRSYWALVVGMFSGSIVACITSNIIHPYRPSFSLRAVNEVAGMSAWIFCNNIVKYLAENAPKLLAGRMIGVSSAGFVSVADEVVRVPTTELVSAINRSTLPGYAKKQGDRDVLKAAYLQVMSVIAIIAFPICLGIYVTAEEIVQVFLGEKWKDIVPVVEWLAISYLFLSLVSNAGTVNMSIGKPKFSFVINLVRVVTMIVASLLFIGEHGILGLVWGICIGAFSAYLVSLSVQLSALKVEISEYVKVVIRPLLSSAIMVAVLSAFQMGGLDSHMALLMGKVLLGFFVYSISLGLAWVLFGRQEGAESFLLNKLFLRK